MSVTGVNRIMIAVRDLEKAKTEYEALLGAEFMDANWTGEAFGIAVAIAWNVGVELCAPLPGREDSSAVTAFLASRGEGIMSVFFDVTDAESAMKRAESQGYSCVHSLDYTQAEIDQYLSGLFKRFQEFNLNTAERLGYTISLARIEAK